MNSNITLVDFLILPIILGFIYLLAFRFRNRHYPAGHPYRKYFIPGLTLKILGAIFIGLIYEYYYKGGDTMNYFNHAKIINSAFNDSPIKWYNLLFRIPDISSIGYYQYISNLQLYNDASSYSVGALAAFTGIFVGTTFLPTSVIFAAVSFTGLWALFRTFASFYPTLIKSIGIAILFIPSLIVWGSGIFKDTICLFALGWLTYGIFQMLIKRNFKFSNIAITTITLFLVYRIKVYILIAFLPALMLWILFSYTQSVKDASVRFFIKTIVFFASIGASVFLFVNLGEGELGRYSFSNIKGTAEVTRDWIIFSSGEEGAAYDLGDIRSFGDFIIKLPLAINVTLFRPYFWESRKIIVFLSAIEAFLFLFLTLKIIFVIGLKKIWRTIATDPNIQFCLTFALIFAFAVGMTSSNFGALSRYKIPCLPFYALGLLLIYYKNRPNSSKLFGPLGI